MYLWKGANQHPESSKTSKSIVDLIMPKANKTGSYSTLAHCTFDKPAFLLSEAPALCDMNPIHVASSGKAVLSGS